jgi:hypothetical protein
MVSIIAIGDAAITLNQGNTFTNPEIVRNALTDHTDMVNK